MSSVLTPLEIARVLSDEERTALVLVANHKGDLKEAARALVGQKVIEKGPRPKRGNGPTIARGKVVEWTPKTLREAVERAKAKLARAVEEKTAEARARPEAPRRSVRDRDVLPEVPMGKPVHSVGQVVSLPQTDAKTPKEDKKMVVQSDGFAGKVQELALTEAEDVLEELRRVHARRREVVGVLTALKLEIPEGLHEGIVEELPGLPPPAPAPQLGAPEPPEDSPAPAKPGSKEQEVLAYVRAHPSCTNRQIYTALKISQTVSSRYLRKLIDRGQVRAIPAGRNGALYEALGLRSDAEQQAGVEPGYHKTVLPPGGRTASGKHPPGYWEPFVLAYVHDHPGCVNSEIVRDLGVAQPVSSKYLLKFLEADQVKVVGMRGKAKMYEAVEGRARPEVEFPKVGEPGASALGAARRSESPVADPAESRVVRDFVVNRKGQFSPAEIVEATGVAAERVAETLEGMERRGAVKNVGFGDLSLYEYVKPTSAGAAAEVDAQRHADEAKQNGRGGAPVAGSGSVWYTPHKDANDFLRKLEKLGADIARQGNDHWCVTNPKNQRSFVQSSTPSRFHWNGARAKAKSIGYVLPG